MIARILLLLCLLACVAPARAAAPLQLYAGISRSDLQRGDPFVVTLSLYSVSPTPTAIELTYAQPPGVELLSTAISTDTIMFNRPMTINVRYRVRPDAPIGGALIVLRYTARDSAGHTTTAETAVRVGSVVWPKAKAAHTVYAPLVAK